MKKKQSVTFLLCKKKIYRLEGVAMAVAATTALVMLFYILFLLFSIRWPHSRGMILRFALSAGLIVVSPHNIHTHTHTHRRAGYFYRRPVYKRHFFFIHPLDVFAILLTFRLSKSKIIFNLFYLYAQAKLHH